MTVRTRFAPSPTGMLHIGGLRTALFNWLFARHHGGEFILRIDDTDRLRHEAAAIQPILDGFKWIGMDWDRGPYYQSRRSDLYKDVLTDLIRRGLLYRDYTTAEEHAAMKSEADRNKVAWRFRAPAYTPQQVRDLIAADTPFCYRFRVPLGEKITIQDHVRGEVTWSTDDISDFVVARQDGSPLYNFATVVDDADMGITHIIRAEEHLPNTFPQILLYRAMGYKVPEFAHVPFVAAPRSKKKLSKRDKDVVVSLEDYIATGYLPEAMMNYLARLGWSLDGETEVMSRDQMISAFSLDRVGQSPAGHDPDKLHWFQGEWMKTKSLEEKTVLAIKELMRSGLVDYETHGENDVRVLTTGIVNLVQNVVAALGTRFVLPADVIRYGKFFFKTDVAKEDYDPDGVEKRLLKPGGIDRILGEMIAIYDAVPTWDVPTLEAVTHEYGENNGIKMGILVNAIRVAATTQPVGPGLYESLVILGRSKTVGNMRFALRCFFGE